MPRPSKAYTPTRGTFAGRRFPSEGAYRKALAAKRPRRSKAAAGTPAFPQLSSRGQEAYLRALDALSWMRSEGLSLRQAARRAETRPSTVLKYVGRAIQSDNRGFYQARPFDRLYRPLQFLTRSGRVSLGVTNSKTASTIARYWRAVDVYLKTGRTNLLREFRRQSIRVDKRSYAFLTDTALLDRLGYAGEVAFEDLYVLTA